MEKENKNNKKDKKLTGNVELGIDEMSFTDNYKGKQNVDGTTDNTGSKNNQNPD